MKIIYFLLSLSFLLMTFNSAAQEFENIEFKVQYNFNSTIESNVEKDTVPWKYQMAAWEYSSKGDYFNALKKWDRELAQYNLRNPYTNEQVDSLNKIYRATNAIEYILNASDSNQIIIINEAHHNSRHRVFTQSLLKDLFEKGYTNLGLEALGNGKYLDSTLNERQYPIQSTGFYTNDPNFGTMIRTALEIGFYVFPYESTVESFDPIVREKEQAKNIQIEIEKKPNEKFLIHCGFDHVFEGKHGAFEKTMAGRLFEYTQIDPFTIDQIEFSERSQEKYNSPILNAIKINEPSILLDQDDMPYKFFKGESYTDVAIFYPKTKLKDDRPEWIFGDGVKNVKIDLSLLDMNYPLMVLAFKANENPSNAVPLDILEIDETGIPCILALKRGRYSIVVYSKSEEAKKFALTVD